MLRSVGIAAGVLLAFGLVDGAAVAAGPDFCRLTSRAALRSCRLEARSDFGLAAGKCKNLSDPAAREACNQQASADRKDALQTCRDQRVARHAVCQRLGEAPYDPMIDPADFAALIDNPYFPLKPGTTFIYEGTTEKGFEHNEVVVTHNTKSILGVECIEIHDIVMIDGELEEDTLDW
ncbi:MAG: hypothetical protein ACREXT_11015, partial [Gammaproteobacteria bacterium]